jgi:hypothetical protein
MDLRTSNRRCARSTWLEMTSEGSTDLPVAHRGAGARRAIRTSERTNLSSSSDVLAWLTSLANSQRRPADAASRYNDGCPKVAARRASALDDGRHPSQPRQTANRSPASSRPRCTSPWRPRSRARRPSSSKTSAAPTSTTGSSPRQPSSLSHNGSEGMASPAQGSGASRPSPNGAAQGSHRRVSAR